MISIEDIGLKNEPVETDIRKNYVSPTDDVLIHFVSDLIDEVNRQSNKILTKSKIDTISTLLKKKYRCQTSKSDIRRIFDEKFKNRSVPPIFGSWLIRKGVRTLSGVKVVTIVLSPDRFSCKYDCAMCPQEKNLKGELTQPRSYLSSEPAMRRALETRVSTDTNNFDVRGQFLNRINTYVYNGIIHKDDVDSKEKIEVILSGGTWESYPKDYREQVIIELYWTANTLFAKRPMKTLEEEKLENETARFRIIGLTLETRPDNITKETIQDYLRWGATRIQIGVQHFDDKILKKINRKCYTVDTIRAIRLLKQAAFKIVVHLMPDLPGSSPQLDKWMFDQALTNPNLQFDDLKLYPTAVCKSSDPDLVVHSKIADWHKDGSYVSYAEDSLDTLIDVLLYYKTRINPWTRIQRLVRDIPGKSIESGYQKLSNLRQIIHERMNKEGLVCNCIYCKEIGDRELQNLVPRLAIRKYAASEGTEYHLSIEAHTFTRRQFIEYYLFIVYSWLMWIFTGTKVYWPGNLDSYTALFGFLRLRIDPEPGGDFVPEIQGCGLIREVHVYGTSLGVGKDAMGSQHRGYGQLLVNQAEKICADHGLTKTAVIAGIGVREYYKNKCGYTKGQAYMLKNISQKNTSEFPMRIMFILFAVLYKLTTFNIVPFDYKYPHV